MSGHDVSELERQMKRTGIFFTCFQGERLKDFPEALDGLDRKNVSYCDAVYGPRDGLFYLEPVAERLLHKVDSRNMIESVKRTRNYESTLYSSEGTVRAARNPPR